MKAGGDKARVQLRSTRLESQRFRLLAVVVGCFLISVTFLLSSRPDASVPGSLSSEGSLEDGRTPAIRSMSSSSSPTRSLGQGFQVDIAPQQPGEGEPAAQEVAETSERTESNEEVDGKTAEEAATPRDEEETTAIVQPTAEATDGEQTDEAPKQGGETNLQMKPTQTEQTQEPMQIDSGGELCDFSDFRTNICDFHGDVRMSASVSELVLVGPTGATRAQTHKVRPYPRKGDDTCMSRVTEITVRTSTDAEAPRRCTKTHTAPAVVFSIGGYTGNIFHDFSDVIVPLYNTVQRYRGDVQLVMTNVASWWLVKYDRLLRKLSVHPPLDFAKAGEDVHCFSHAIVSLRAHRELIIERERSLDGLATPDFTRFLRAALSLDRDAPTLLGERAGKQPRLLIISRRRTRLLLNIDAIVVAAREVGFDVVVNESDVADDIVQIGRLINSCDAMVGVHGAGLTNMMFLPPNGTLIQIVPWGGLQWIARMDYGEPAAAMGLKYIEYDIAIDESSLKDKYPRDHEIFTNPFALHKRGFGFMKKTLMDGQNITIDVNRFKGVLLQALDHLVQ